MRKLALAATLLVVAACSPGLDVDTYPTEPNTEIACKALLADLPTSVAGEDSILVAGNNAAAWGAPPIILRCGVEPPAIMDTDPPCNYVAGVDWVSETTADGFLFTTIGRQFRVSVEVPDAYDPAAEALADLAGAVTKHDPSVTPCE
ncbi:MAG: DUF3515 family protein [Aeromicrobium sp.]